MVLTTLLVEVSMTEMLSDPELATKMKLPSGLATIPFGFIPTATVETTLSTDRLMTETLLESSLLT